jgi:hypothetical protein
MSRRHNFCLMKRLEGRGRYLAPFSSSLVQFLPYNLWRLLQSLSIPLQGLKRDISKIPGTTSELTSVEDKRPACGIQLTNLFYRCALFGLRAALACNLVQHTGFLSRMREHILVCAIWLVRRVFEIRVSPDRCVPESTRRGGL